MFIAVRNVKQRTTSKKICQTAEPMDTNINKNTPQFGGVFFCPKKLKRSWIYHNQLNEVFWKKLCREISRNIRDNNLLSANSCKKLCH